MDPWYRVPATGTAYRGTAVGGSGTAVLATTYSIVSTPVLPVGTYSCTAVHCTDSWDSYICACVLLLAASNGLLQEAGAGARAHWQGIAQPVYPS